MTIEPTVELAEDDLRRVLRTMPRDMRQIMLERGRVASNLRLFLAGGAIRSIIAGEPISDWDLLGASKAAVLTAIDTLAAGRSGIPTRAYRSRNAMTMLSVGHTPVQGIHRWTYEEPLRLLAEFDFTVAQAVVWSEDGKWRSLASGQFYADLAAKRLRYTEPKREEDAGGSMLRVLKFVRRGYSIGPEDLGKVMGRMVTRYREGSGVDAGLVMAGLLREVDPLGRIEGLDVDDPEAEGDPLNPDGGVPE